MFDKRPAYSTHRTIRYTHMIEIKNLTFAYTGREKPTICNINLSVKPGDFVVLCGPTGCGKSTLLRQLKPAIAPAGKLDGEISFCGKNITEYRDRELAEKIGFVMQNSGHQIVCDKVWHELAFGLESIGTKQEVMRRRIAETAGYFGLEKYFYSDVEVLSGGQKQILSLASVMVMRPLVLVLDEPVSQLDPASAEKFLTLIGRINKDLGVTVILSEHRTDDVLTYADRLVVMEEGHMVCDDTPERSAAFLKRTGSRMFLAMPASARIFDKEEKLPMTVRDARLVLTDKIRGGVKRQNEVTDSMEDLNTEKTGKNYPPVMTCKDISFRYDRDDIVKDLSIDIYGGEVLAILGANGSGKSTLLSLLARINRPYSGKIVFMGKDIKRYSEKEFYRDGVAMLPQDPQTLFVKDSVREELLNIAKTLNLEMECEEIVDGLMDLMELKDLADRHPYDLSGGEQQKLAIAMVLAVRPRLILMDEPTKGMDAAFKSVFADVLKNLTAEGISVVLVSHDTEFCAEHADRCALMFCGEITDVSDPKSFFGDNFFVSPAAARIANGLLPGAVTVECVKRICPD